MCEIVSRYHYLLKYIDLEDISFIGIDIRNKDLSDTGATININEVYEKDNKIDETDYEKAKQYIKSLFNQN